MVTWPRTCVRTHTIELMPSSKEGVIWSILNGSFISILNSVSIDGETYWWECRYRKSSRCSFRMTSRVEDDDEEKDEVERKHEIVWMMDPDIHIFGQDKVDVIVTKFKADVVNEMKVNFKAKFTQIYESKKKAILKEVVNSDLKERVRYALPAAASLKTAAHRARQRGVPPAPRSLAEVDLSLLPSSSSSASSSASSSLCLVGEDKENMIWVFGTKELAREFCSSSFKSSDGTFKIAPRLCYQGATPRPFLLNL